MNQINTIALAKAVAEKTTKAAREGLAVGTHEIDMTVRIHGTMTVAEDTSKVPTVSIPMKETLALFIKYSGITAQHATALLTRAMTEALAANDEGEQGTEGKGAILAALPILESTMANVVKPMLESLPKTPVKGAVKTKFNITEMVGELV